MVFTKEDKALIANLYLMKVGKLMREFTGKDAKYLDRISF